MTRDPSVQHDDAELREGLSAAQQGADLHDREPLREELVFLGLLRVAEEDELLLTPEGRRFLQ